MEKRYTALRTIGTVYKILGIVSGALTLLAVLGFCAASVFGSGMMGDFGRPFGGPMFMRGAVGGLVGAFLVILYGGGLAITFYAFGEGIDLLISLEENTRATARMLEGRAAPPAGTPAQD